MWAAGGVAQRRDAAMYGLLLACHIAAGSVALLAAAGALAARKGGPSHVRAGRTFALGMLVVFVTAVPMTVLRPNLFLLLIAVFSFYLVATGWRRARHRDGTPAATDWTAASVMAATALAMVIAGAERMRGGDPGGIVLIVFGAIGGSLALADVLALRRRAYRGRARIAAHLTRMLAGTVGAVTAFTVVNLSLEPELLEWLAPTVLLTPVIVYWIRRVSAGDEFVGTVAGSRLRDRSRSG